MPRVLLVATAVFAFAACGGGAEVADPPAPVEFDEEGMPDADSSGSSLSEPESASASTGVIDEGDPRLGFQGRADINQTGNKVSSGAGDLTADPIVMEFESAAEWLVPSSPEPDAPWVGVFRDGTLRWIDPVAGTDEILDPAWGDAEPVVRGTEGVAPWDLTSITRRALPDGRSVADGQISVILADPTDRYGHAVLGDDIEAAAIEVYSAMDGGINVRVELEDDVVEGRSALLGDVDGDGTSEILVTLSNSSGGARLVVYDDSLVEVAASAPIGRGNRWRNQMAIAPVGPNGEIEIVDIRTPHLGRTIEYFRIEGDELIRVATRDGFTSHVLGSRNLELAIVADPDGDGRLEVVAPTSDRSELGVVARTDDGTEVEFLIDLDSRLSSNIGAVDHPDGTASYSVGTSDGLVRWWLS